MSEAGLSELYATVVSWAAASGARYIDQLDHPWTGETDEWKVTINATGQTVDNLPHMAVQLEHKIYLAICIVAPNGGLVTGESEDALIAHFKCQTEEASHAQC